MLQLPVSPVLLDARVKAHSQAAFLALGQGRNGTAKSSEKEALEVKLAMPSSLGGKGDGQNPEVLFAMGYSCKSPCSLPKRPDFVCPELSRLNPYLSKPKACFLASMQLHAHNTKKTVPKDTKVYATVHLGQPSDMDGFGIAVDIEVEGVEDQELIDGGHAVSFHDCSPTPLPPDGRVKGVT